MADPSLPPENIAQIVDTIWASVKSSPGAIVAGIAALGAAVVGYLTARTNTASTEKVSVGDHAIRLLGAQAAQFEALVTGYKVRVDELTHEVCYLRHRIDDLMRAIEFRLDACIGCEHAPKFLKVLLDEPQPSADEPDEHTNDNR